MWWPWSVADNYNLLATSKQLEASEKKELSLLTWCVPDRRIIVSSVDPRVKKIETELTSYWKVRSFLTLKDELLLL